MQEHKTRGILQRAAGLDVAGRTGCDGQLQLDGGLIEVGGKVVAVGSSKSQHEFYRQRSSRVCAGSKGVGLLEGLADRRQEGEAAGMKISASGFSQMSCWFAIGRCSGEVLNENEHMLMRGDRFRAGNEA